MTEVYKIIIGEYHELNNDIINNSDKYIYKNFEYKIHTIQSSNILFKCYINIIYKNIKYEIITYYNNLYPHNCPTKIQINGINMIDIYNDIISKNNDLFKKSLLSWFNNWTDQYSIRDIIDEVIKIIEYKELYIKRILLNKITSKYTNEYLDYLHYYLIT